MKKIVFVMLMTVSAVFSVAQTSYQLSRVHDSINTVGSETGAIIVDDSVLLYTTMTTEESSRLYLMDFNPTLTQVHQAPIAADGTLGAGTLCCWGMNVTGVNCGNTAYDAKRDILYMTRSQGRDDIKQIYYSRRTNGRWSKAQPLGGDVNLKGYSSTHPAVGYLSGGETILYFSSDRPGGLGGMDIWYAVIIDDGKPGNCTNLGAPVNTDSNEVTPFYCNEEGMLYFSSNREGGKGGFDVYRSEGMRNRWQLPQTLGDQVNSKYDDLFFSVQPCRCRCVEDTTNTNTFVEACGFLSSNRPGTLFKSDSNCCHDLFRWSRLRIKEPETEEIVENITSGAKNALDLLPLSLYFHNDEPSPRTLDTTTNFDYNGTWKRYMQMRDEYKGAQPSPADHRKWDSIQKAVDYFFDNEVRKGHTDLSMFFEFLYQDLKEGKRVRITVNGFASPLFESEYNVNLSKRRIDCFKNQLKHWNDQALLPFLNTGMLKIESVAFGAPDENEVAASDPMRNPRSEKSVYSMEAAHNRRIDIIGYTIEK